MELREQVVVGIGYSRGIVLPASSPRDGPFRAGARIVVAVQGKFLVAAPLGHEREVARLIAKLAGSP